MPTLPNSSVKPTRGLRFEDKSGSCDISVQYSHREAKNKVAPSGN